MFISAFQNVQSSAYGILGQSSVSVAGQPGPGFTFDYGTGFAIAPGIILTAAHVIHSQGMFANKIHSNLLVMHATDIAAGRPPLNATLLAESNDNDIALLKISGSNNNDYVRFHRQIPPIGSSVGAIGFPDTHMIQSVKNGVTNFQFTFQLTFVGSFVSRMINFGYQGRNISGFATDGNVYEGASGGPVFLRDGAVCGMQVGYAMNAKRERQSYTHCIPSEQLIAFANKHGVKITEASGNTVGRI